jgi:tetratricopeptide (TPR) repeat protein
MFSGVLAVLWVTLLLLPNFGQAATARLASVPKRVGVDPIPDVVVMENNSGAYLAWRQAEVYDRVLIHFDSHLDVEWMDAVVLHRILNAPTPQALQDLERDPYDLHLIPDRPLDIKNFIYPAIKSGMVREMYWVILEDDLAALLHEYTQIVLASVKRLPLADLDSVQLDGGRIRMQLYGMPLTICRLADLPAIDEPVLLDVDMDYFDSPYLTTRLALPKLWPGDVVEALKAKGLRTDLVTVAYSNREGYLDLAYRYLGDELVTLLRDPPRAQASSHQVFAHHRASDRLRAAGQLQEAVAELQQGLRIDPGRASLHYNLSLLYDALGRAPEAAQARQRAMELDAAYAQSALYLADWFFQKRLHAEAIPLYRELVQRQPRSLYLRFRLAEANLATRQVANAIAHLAVAAELAPHLADVHRLLGDAHAMHGDVQAAIDAYRRAIALDPGLDVAYYGLGNGFVRQREAVQALGAYRQALALNPTLASARTALGNLLARRGRYDEAEMEYRQALRINPRMPDVYFNLGELYAAQGDISQAVAWYRRFLEAWSGDQRYADLVRRKLRELQR